MHYNAFHGKPGIQVFAGFICCMMIACNWAQSEDLPSVETRMRSDISYLASDELEGRDVGSEGNAKAAEFIAKRFAELGYETDKFDGGPFQQFAIPGRTALGPAEKNVLTFQGYDSLPTLKLQEHYSPLALGNSGEFDGEVVFVGFGITAPEHDYDDYAGMDIEGKIVIALRKEPQQSDPNSKFDGTQNSQYAMFTTKELNASVHKVAALILVNDTQTAASDAGDKLMQVGEANGAALVAKKVPTIFCSRSFMDPLVKAGTGKSLDELQKQIDVTGKPNSVVLKNIRAKGSVSIESKDTIARNVVGFLPGRGGLASEYVVVGAHYDHVGMGGFGSLAPGTIAVHNGADDNASGTSTMLEVARRMAKDEGSQSRRGLIFIAFSGEERGLLGSKHYVRNPRWPLEKTVTMVNMDMVGRVNENSLTIYGTGTAKGFDALVDSLNERTKFNLDKQVAGYGPSDHQSFYEVEIPVFHFFTGLHNEYHRPSDDVELINFEGMSRVADMVTDLVIDLATRGERPELLKISAVADVGRRGRATLGIQMDANTEAVVVQSVNEGGPAQKAGIEPGDTIIKIGDAAIPNSRDLRRVMARKRTGEVVEVTVLRSGIEQKVEVKLGN
jgi:Peptidase family M28/PDZ domain/PA domain